MIAQTDLDRALNAWFTSEAAGTPPAAPLARVIESTRTIRPRPALTAAFGSAWVGSSAASRPRFEVGPQRRVVRLALVALLILALVGAAVLVGSRLLVTRPTPRTYLDRFVAAPAMSALKAFPSVVTLLDGRVLVIGNEGDGGSQIYTGLVYDPGTGVSVTTGPLLSADGLTVSALVRLLDGRVLVVGATESQVFDPVTMQFAPVGSMTVPDRWGAAAALLPDGHVLVAGGSPSDGGGSPIRSAELFDPRTMTFSPTGSMAAARSNPTMVTLPDGRVFLAPDVSHEAELYDPGTATFVSAGVAPDYLSGRAVALSDGRVLMFVIQGLQTSSLAWTWDSADSKFSYLQHVPPVFTATQLDDGRVLVTGGKYASFGGVLDPTTATFSYIAPPTAYRPAATRLTDGRVLLVGGLLDGNIRPTNGGSMAPGVPTVEIFQ